MPELLETLTSYVPPPVARHFAADPSPLTAPVGERFPAAVFFADISGFTELTETLAEQGPQGAEELTRLLNDYFGRLINLISAQAGEVVKFAGDALLAVWPATEEDLATVTARAAHCGLVIQEMLHDYEATAGIHLSLHIGIGVGDVFTAYLGGVFGRWEYLVAGNPLVQMSLAEQRAKPGQVVISPEAWALVEDRCSGRKLAGGYVRLTSMKKPVRLRTLHPLHLRPEMENALRAYIPGAIIARIAAGQSGWLAELRRVTVLFIHLPDLDYRTPVEKGQSITQSLQTALYRYEGSINKLNVDDKGTTLVAALGLPPLSHEDDPARGVLAALAIMEELKKVGLHGSVGVTTGRAFCGSVGNDTRREYTMIGDVVNLAARLMVAAKGRILCDEATYAATQEDFDYEVLPPITLKGKSRPAAIFRPVSEVQSPLRAQTMIIGRVEERAILAEHIQALLRGSPGGVIIIEGEPGIGKSRLVEDLRRQADALHVTAFLGGGDAIERSTPYHAWRGVFNGLLDLEWIVEPEMKRLHLQNILELEPKLAAHAPLLNQVLGLDLAETPETEELSAKGRVEATRDYMLNLLHASVIRSPKLVILEDAHWLDSASWALLLEVSKKVRPFLLVLATRPMTDPLPPEYSQLVADPEIHWLRLGGLSPDDTLALIRQRLGVHSLPGPVADLIRDRAEGHPFFSEELAYALRDAGLMIIKDEEALLAPEAGDLRALALPDTVEGVITSRIDRLLPPQQLALKVASVIGRVFAYRTLHDIYPIEDDRTQLPEYLSTLHRLDITPLETPEPDLAYIFKHIITQEVTYNLMAFSQRRQLHKAAAQWYEKTYEALDPYYPILAHHWTKAQDTLKAVFYLDKAGDQAVRNGANAEATERYEMALTVLKELPESAEVSQQYVDIAIKYSRATVLALNERTVPILENALGAANNLQDEERRARVLGSLGAHTYVRGQIGQAMGYFSQTVALAETLGLDDLLTLPYNLMGRTLLGSGDFARSSALLEKGIPLAEKANDLELLAGSHCFLAYSLWAQGEWQKAAEHAHKGVRLAEEIRMPSRLAANLMLRGLAYALYGHFDMAFLDLNRCLEMAEGTHDFATQYVTHGWLGNCYRLLGDLASARRHLERCLEITRQARAVFSVPTFQAFYADVMAQEGNREGGLAEAASAMGLAEQTQQRNGQADARRFMARIMLMDDAPDWAAAEEHLKQSITLAESGNGAVYAAITRLDLARLYQKKGQTVDGLTTLDDAEVVFKQCQMHWYLEQAGELKKALTAV